MCRCIRAIECCADSSITYAKAIVISICVICATIIIYKLISLIYDSTYIIYRKRVDNELLLYIFLVSILLVIFEIIIMLILVIYENTMP